MAFLNTASTKIFISLIERLSPDGYAKLKAAGQLDLHIERFEEAFTIGRFSALLYSVCQTYKQNGDLMRSPEMCFLVINPDVLPTIMPVMYRQDDIGLLKESMTITDEKKAVIVDLALYRQHLLFATEWLKNIKRDFLS